MGIHRLLRQVKELQLIGQKKVLIRSRFWLMDWMHRNPSLCIGFLSSFPSWLMNLVLFSLRFSASAALSFVGPFFLFFVSFYVKFFIP